MYDGPLMYKLYKGMGGKNGCFQFKLIPAKINKDTEEKEPGVVFIEAAPTTGPNIYDWANKIQFALAITDLGKLLVGFNQDKMDLFHDPDAQTVDKGTRVKTLSLSKGQTPGTYFLKLTQVNKSSVSPASGTITKSVNISMQADEAKVLYVLLEAAIPRILDWT